MALVRLKGLCRRSSLFQTTNLEIRLLNKKNRNAQIVTGATLAPVDVIGRIQMGQRPLYEGQFATAKSRQFPNLTNRQ